jgi:hypothetical protein
MFGKTLHPLASPAKNRKIKKADSMKNTVLFPALTALLLVAGCSTTTTLTTPEKHPGKYALQVIQIEVPLPETHETLSSCAMISDDVESLLKNPQAVITEFPIVYAAVGETGINDQTETLTFPDIDEPAKVGRYTEMTLQEVGNGMASCDLWFYNKSLQGMQKTGETSKPVFKKREMKTQIALVPGNWMSMGGSIIEKTEDFSSGKKVLQKTTRTRTVLAIRILPPANTL